MSACPAEIVQGDGVRADHGWPSLPFEVLGPYAMRTSNGGIRAQGLRSPGTVGPHRVPPALNLRCRGVLLQNHRATTYGDALATAYSRSMYLEWLCRIYGEAKALGEPRLLTVVEFDAVAGAVVTYGKFASQGRPRTGGL